MKIALIGYMGAGKTYWAQKLAEALQCQFIDLDKYLEEHLLNMSIFDFVQSKGELAFRKKEREALLMLTASNEDFVLATGGGTPCYYDNMEVLNQALFTIYLDIPIKKLADRLVEEKDHRPLISHLTKDEIMEFIAKHLFERRVFYNMAQASIYEKDLNLDSLLEAIENNSNK